jgi:hypothetical protein
MTREQHPVISGQADESGWTVHLNDAVHRVDLGPPTALHGRPTSFVCDGVAHPLKVPVIWYGTPPAIIPFSIGGTPASLSVSVTRLSMFERLKRVPRFWLGGGLGDVWNFELMVDQHRLGMISQEYGGRAG